MKCLICKGEDLERRQVEEEIRSGSDIVLLPIEVLVCLGCGERYYDRRTMKKIEDARDNARQNTLKTAEVGKVLRADSV